MNKKNLILLLSIFFLWTGACDDGLTPDDKLSTIASFSGTIRVKGGKESWPDSSEMFGIRVGAFKTADPSSLIGEVVSGNAYFTFNSVGSYFDSIAYTIEIEDAPADLKYSIVAWQFDSLLTDQRVVAVYGGDQRQSFLLLPGDSLTDIDFLIDFENLPEQPF